MYRIVRRAPVRLITQIHEFVTNALGVLGLSGIVFIGILSVFEL
jgi:hypothetical protein